MWHLAQGCITQVEVMVWLSVLSSLITVDQTLLSHQIVSLARHAAMIRSIGEIPSICFILACMDSDRGPKAPHPGLLPSLIQVMSYLEVLQFYWKILKEWGTHQWVSNSFKKMTFWWPVSEWPWPQRGKQLTQLGLQPAFKPAVSSSAFVYYLREPITK